MSRSLNKVTLIGNVGQDPEVRAVNTGSRVASFSLATTRSWGGSGGAEKQEKTEWHRCVAWNNKGGSGMGLADIIERYVKKGDKLYIEGRIEYRDYTDKDGQKKYITEINVRELIMLSGRGEGGESGGGARSRATPAAGAKKTAPAGATEDFEDFPNALEETDDDLPF